MAKDEDRGDIPPETGVLMVIGELGFIFLTLSIASFILYGILQFIIWPLFGIGGWRGFARFLGQRSESVGTGSGRGGRMVSLRNTTRHVSYCRTIHPLNSKKF